MKTSDIIRNVGKTLSPLLPPKFTYMGAGAKHHVLKEWIKLNRGASKYVDLTAGSNNQPYVIGRHLGIPVFTNDANYYSFCIASGLFERQSRTDLDMVLEGLLLASSNLLSGFFHNLRPGNLHEDVYLFVDAWIDLVDSTFPIGHKEYVLACTGAAILKTMTFRALGNLGSNKMADGTECSVKVFANKVFKTVVSKNDHRLTGESIASFSNATDFVDKFDHFSGANVSFDPAWPYKQGSGSNPYHLYHRIGEVLAQKETPKYIWPDDVSVVLKDVIFWTSRVLDRGAARVFIWNQTTNMPSKQELELVLSDEFVVTNVLNTDHKTIAQGKSFNDYVLCCEKKTNAPNHQEA